MRDFEQHVVRAAGAAGGGRWDATALEQCARGRARRATALEQCVRGRAAWAALLTAGLTALVGGCSPDIAWRGFAYAGVQDLSRKEHRLTFVYMRDWISPKCTQFEENVLKSAPVRAATEGLNCAKVQWDTLLDRPLAAAWGVNEAPAVVILDPEEHPLAVLTGEIAPEALLKAIADAKATFATRHAPPAAPAAGGTPTPPAPAAH